MRIILGILLAVAGGMLVLAGCRGSSASGADITAQTTYCTTLGHDVNANGGTLEILSFANLPTSGMGDAFDNRARSLHKLGVQLEANRPLTGTQKSAMSSATSFVTTTCSYREPRDAWPNNS